MSAAGQEITVTLVHSATGQSESIGVHSTSTSLNDLQEWSRALLGMEGSLVFYREGVLVGGSDTLSLEQAGIRHGDLLAVQSQQQAQASPPAAATAAPAPPAAGGLDFSSLLSAAPAPAPTTTTTSSSPRPVYFPGMSFDDAMQHNPHPASMVQLLLEKEHLRKELNYHSPQLAYKLLQEDKNQSFEEKVAVWREFLVKGGIQSALERTQKYHQEKTMKDRLARNPHDLEAKEYFDQQSNQQLIHQQYTQMMQEYPEAMGRVLMLYINAKVNEHEIQAFVDSGAQSTIMSKKCASECGLLHLVDKRFAGVAVGVGQGKILGRIHMVQLQLQEHYFPCTVTVMDDVGLGDQNMDFLLGLDMLKRHTCRIDLERGVLTFRLAPGKYMEAPFLHEKDLDETKGGTKGFDAEKANQKLQQAMDKEEEGNDKSDGGAAPMDDGN